MKKPKLRLNNIESYLDSSLEVLEANLKSFFGELDNLTIGDVKDKLHDLNAYENLRHLQEVDHEKLIILDEESINTTPAEEVILNGQFFWEHAAAGEATRLGLGTKYVLNLSEFSLQKIHDLILNEARESKTSGEFESFKKEFTLEKLESSLICKPQELLPLNLGTRHMLQAIYDIKKLAAKRGFSAQEIISRQQMLIILNEATTKQIIGEFIRYNFFSLKRENIFFMVQKSFYGITLKNGKLIYTPDSDKRLHNHGQMFLQKLHDNSIFFIDKHNSRHYLTYEEYISMLRKHVLMLSYNIEDTGYLTGSIDFPGLALAYELSKDGFEMIMEIVKQNPVIPQKGGAAYFDPRLGRVCMIESNRLKGIKNEDIKLLNRNFNIYPNPSSVLERLREGGLPMPFDIKKSNQGEYHLYFNPIQGDINFLAKTAFVMRKSAKPIQNLKTPLGIPDTIDSMHNQDLQPGFRELAEELVLKGGQTMAAKAPKTNIIHGAENKTQKRILVCGGAGFIGSHLCKYLVEKGNEVICVDNLCTGSADNIKPLLGNRYFTFIEQDIIEPLRIDGQIDQIYNMASRASPPNYQSEPVHTLLTNSIGNDNLLKLALEKDAVFFFASTSEVYGDPLEHPQRETYWGNVNPTGMRSCYDESKRFGEALCMAYKRRHNSKIRIVRIFNTYGPNMQREDGRVITNLISQALNNEDMTIYGDGTQTRAFCYVDDEVEGIYRLMNSDISTPVNIGNPNEFTILELAGQIKKITGTDSKIVFRPLPSDDPLRRRPDIAIAKNELGWEPKISLEEGLRRTIEYFRKMR